ncbi:MAG TPA: PDZ domain-containing protein [Kofleriaceae bacterium]|nr:PDZ domain-containing protein [Kofleriaceae bacterium]
MVTEGMTSPGPWPRYRLAVREPERHLCDVELAVSGIAGLGTEVDLSMAAWCPGSYLIRDYARFVQELSAADGAGAALAVTKVDKQTWRVQTGGAAELVVRYRVYGHDLSVRTNHIEGTHAFLHPAATYLWIEALRHQPHRVEVDAPAGWTVATGLARDGEGWRAGGLDELLDCPVHVGVVDERALSAAGVPLRLVTWGEPEPLGIADADQLAADLTAIVESHAARFGGVPFSDYTFLLMLAPRAYGGLEHRNSSANLNTPFAFASRKSYQELLELLSHEFFHVWNGKRIFPAGLHPFDYRRENYTRCLWVMEGLTSYYDRLQLRLAGVMAPNHYLDKLAEDWCRYLATPGRRLQSLEESSFDAWIKLYQPHESLVNTSMSYYLKGGLVALALDFEIQRRTEGARSLDDVLLHLWTEYGASGAAYPEDVQPVFEAAAGIGLGEFFDRFVRGREDPDLAGELRAAGLELRMSWDPGQTADGAVPVWLGASLEEGRVVLATVLHGGPAEQAGLAPGDELLAVDRRRVRSEAELRERLAARRPGQRAELMLARQGRILEVALELAEGPRTRCEIAGVAQPTEAQGKFFQRWLRADHPGAALTASYNHAKPI